MMLVNAGPLVALTDASDPNHDPCRHLLARIQTRLLTVWPAFTEAMHLVRRSARAQDELMNLVERGAIGLAPLAADDMPRIRELIRKYRDLPMDFADAALVRVAERERIRRVFTLDRRDFQVYRPRGLSRFDILP